MTLSFSLANLERMEDRRGLFGPPCGDVVTASLARFLPPEGLVLEIGCGAGQSRAWLTEAQRARLVHSDMSAAFTAKLTRRWPDARGLTAAAEALPLRAGSLAAVVGLCAFDAVTAPARARDEVARVLGPGGVFVHWLDMTTHLEPVFETLGTESLVAFPNFVADYAHAKGTLDGVPSPLRGHIESFLDPLDDLVVLPSQSLRELVELLRRAHDPLGDMLSAYADRFAATPPEPAEAAQAFVDVTHHPEAARHLGHVMTSLFLMLWELAPAAHLAAAFRPASSTRHFAARLATLFGSGAGFTVLHSDVICARREAEPPPDWPATWRYYTRRVGHTWASSTPPPAFGVPVATFSAAPAPPDPGPSARLSVESGVFTFVARRS